MKKNFRLFTVENVIIAALVALTFVGAGVTLAKIINKLDIRPTTPYNDYNSVMGSGYFDVDNPTRANDEMLIASELAYPGIDVSHWQGVMNWQKAYDSGARFAFIRAGSVDATTCVPYKDSQFDRNSVEASKAGLYVDYYWFFYPNCDPIAQAQAFYQYISDKPRNMYPVLDVEKTGNQSASQIASTVWVFQDQIKKLMNTPTMIYTSPGFWNSRVARTNWAHTLPIWVAHWEVTSPILPYDWSNYGENYTFWQTHVGKDGNLYGAQSASIDHDVFGGVEAEFKERFGELQPTPTPTNEPTTIPTGEPTVTPQPPVGDVILEEISVRLSNGKVLHLYVCQNPTTGKLCYCER